MQVWRRLPSALVVGFALALIGDVARVVDFWNFEVRDRAFWELFEVASGVAAPLVLGAGLVALARRLTGRAALGARIAAAAQLGDVVLTLGWLAINLVFRHHPDATSHVTTVLRVMQYGASAASLAAAVGFGLATQHRAFAIGLPVAAVVLVPIPPLGRLLFDHAVFHSQRAQLLLESVPYVVLAVAFAVAAIVSVRGELVAEVPVRLDRAFARAASALWLRVIVALALSGLTLFIALAHAADLLGLLKGMTMLAPVVEIIALALFARAALALARSELAPWTGALAAGASLWSASVLAYRIPLTYDALYGGDALGGSLYSMSGQRDALELATSGSLIQPLIAGLAVFFVLLAIARLARERGAHELRENVNVQTGVFVVLVLGALFIVRYGGQRMSFDAPGLVAFAMLAAAAAALYAFAMAAKLCRQAGELAALDPVGLPTATLVKGNDA